jgi:hypothetical protein
MKISKSIYIYIVTYSVFTWLIRRVLDLMTEFIRPIYNWLQQFTYYSLTLCHLLPTGHSTGTILTSTRIITYCCLPSYSLVSDHSTENISLCLAMDICEPTLKHLLRRRFSFCVRLLRALLGNGSIILSVGYLWPSSLTSRSLTMGLHVTICRLCAYIRNVMALVLFAEQISVWITS